MRISSRQSASDEVAHLIKKQQISVVEHSPRQLELHLPSTGEAANNLCLTVIIETNLDKLVPDLVAGDISKSLV